MNLGERREGVNQQVQDGTTAPGGSQYDGAMRNTLKTVVIVVIMYFVCWTPNECLWGLQYVGLITIDFTSWIYGFSTVRSVFALFHQPADLRHQVQGISPRIYSNDVQDSTIKVVPLHCRPKNRSF
jgi:hypothetical protein